MNNMLGYAHFANALLESGMVVGCIMLLIMIRLFPAGLRKQRIAMIVCVSATLTVAVADIVAFMMERTSGDVWHAVAMVSATVAFIAANVILPSFTYYLVETIKTPASGLLKNSDEMSDGDRPWYSFGDDKFSILDVWSSVLVVTSTFLAAGVFLGLYFEVDEGNVVRRYDLYALVMVNLGIAIIVDAAILVQFRKYVARKTVVVLVVAMSVIVLSLVGEVAFRDMYLNIGILGCGISCVIVYVDMLHTLVSNLSEARGMASSSQINQHFVGNTLALIHHLCMSNPAEAARASEVLADHLRYIVEVSQAGDACVPIEREMENVREYLELRRMASPDMLHYEIREECGGFEVPPLSVLTLVENAVDHGIGASIGGGTVEVVTRKAHDAFEVAVIDDGVGFVVGQDQGAGSGVSKRSHVGLMNTRYRVEHLSMGEFQIDSAPGFGTQAFIRIPE